MKDLRQIVISFPLPDLTKNYKSKVGVFVVCLSVHPSVHLSVPVYPYASV